VKRHRHIFLLAAFALLLAAAADLLIVDFASGMICDDDQVPGSSNGQPDDDCFCCCAHIEMLAAPITLPSEPSQAFEPSMDSDVVSLLVRTVYHPPRV
jgi:hypothetical protein